MTLDDRLRDRQAETGSRDRLLRRVGAAEEPLEEPVLLLRGNPDAGVGDLDDCVAAVCETRTETLPDAGVNLRALEIRLSRTCARRDRSPSIEGVSARSVTSSTCLSSATGFAASMHSASTSFRSTSLEVERELARLDLRHEEQVADELHEPLRVPLHDREEPRCSGPSSPAPPSSTSSRYPWIDVSGVRSSCETSAMNSSFSRSSSRSRSFCSARACCAPSASARATRSFASVASSCAWCCLRCVMSREITAAPATTPASSRIGEAVSETSTSVPSLRSARVS